MKKLISIVALLLVSFAVKAQDFESYKAFGLQVSKRFTNLNVKDREDVELTSTGQAGRGFDVIAHYDNGVKKWFGVGVGLGISSIGSSVGGDKQLYYAVLPLRMQIKMGSVWLEPGLENRFFLWMDEGNRPNYVNSKSANTYHLAGNLGLRFKLFRGLSINAGVSASITPVISLEKVDVKYGNTYYNSIAGFVGVRYMFNQPY
ncbi:hypothetical protein Oweho_1592 [Owenweeksia hongkongensis DSM 17368]|uniref:Outer membrane protein beta-barrel domain-containing protein n=1 Tax=Owenweeksia hongkongensis (strain DSM 17368 / CIP 108786 / JCM 12287 / NRRL B-23963 / UST20020801) TaxID=926562 RepID=G8QZF4_OWEHD|nr:hypothetical protein [Owenweeksia hongkongensis]AEV32582.1 hypothetical protein Oweho_1592 [Owenweeksia hongkongensis DSM 17368]